MSKASRIELSEKGKIRKREILRSLSSQISQDAVRRRNRRRLVRTASLAALLILMIGGTGYFLFWNSGSDQRPNQEFGNVLATGHGPAKDRPVSEDDVTRIDATHTDATRNDDGQPGNHPANGTGNKPGNSGVASRAKLVSMNCVVTNSDLSPPAVEKLTDDQLLALLQESGVKAWIAEIDQQRVVITNDGSRL